MTFKMPTGSGAINERVKELLSVFVRSKSPDYLLPQVLIEAVSNKIRFLYINREGFCNTQGHFEEIHMSGCCLSKTTTTAQEGKYCCGREWENPTTTPSSNCTIQQSESYYDHSWKG